jgi:predicted HicB family RNase H-like nuclease
MEHSAEAERSEPPKRGRKRLPPGASKSARVELRVTDSTKAGWQAKADAAGLSLNAWAEATLNAAKK